MNSKFENSLKASLRRPEAHPGCHDLEKVTAAAEKIFVKKRSRKRISFTAFLIRQMKYTAWKIWALQGLLLLVLCPVLFACFGSLLLSRPQHVAVLLSGSAILVLLTAIPFVQRGVRYKMCEVEAAAKFSSARLLAARLLVIGIGDSIMLGSVFLLALLKTTVSTGTAALCIMLPFLAVSSAYLYILGHIPVHRISVCCIGISAVVFLAIAALCYFYPDAAKQSFSLGWGLLCLVFTVFCIYQLHYILRRSSLPAMQTI